MKYAEKVSLFLFAVLTLLPTNLAAQNASSNQEDAAAIKQTVLDYGDGYYAGDAGRMEKAIHPDINKATPRDLPQTSRTILAYTTYSALIELTRAKVGVLADSARHVQVQILNIDEDAANAKIVSAKFIDYLQLVKLDGQWKIVNVLFTSGSDGPPRLKEFKIENEKAAIERTAMNYLAGMSGADAARVEMAICPEFSKLTLNVLPADGKPSFRRQRYESLIENTFAGVGKQDEIYRNNRVAILDVFDGMAVARCDMNGAYEFVQMYKSGGEWKILNSLVKRNTSVTLTGALTVIAGEPMIDFTLPIFGGGEFDLSKYRGKNVLLIFPRGWVGNSWCAYCPYQYLEIEQLEKSSNIRAKNSLEIAFVMPYSSELVKNWMERFPDELQFVENNKNPKTPPPPGSIQAAYGAWVKKHFPLKFDVKKDTLHKTIPVLVDEDRTLSRQLKIFTGFWDGNTSEQNMASIFIIDKKGILRFKDIGQMTEDRPSTEFLLDFIKTMK